MVIPSLLLRLQWKKGLLLGPRMVSEVLFVCLFVFALSLPAVEHYANNDPCIRLFLC